MLLSPLYYESHCARRKFPSDDFEGLNVNKRFEFSIQRMEVRWNMISEIHLDQYPVKSTDSRHLLSFSGIQTSLLLPFHFKSQVAAYNQITLGTGLRAGQGQAR